MLSLEAVRNVVSMLRHKLRKSLFSILVFGRGLSGIHADAQALPASCPIPTALQEAFASHPGARDYKALGLQFSNQHDFACAIAAYRKAVELQPAATDARRKLAEARNSLGLIRGQTGDSQEAEELLREAAESDPAYFEPYLNLSMLMAAQGRFAEAAKQAEAALRLAPGNANALTTLAMIRTRLGQTSEAASIFRKLVALHPNSAEAHINLGIALADGSDLSLALEEFTKAVRLAPHTAAAHLNRGRVLSDLRRYSEAKTELDIANKLEPNSANILYRLALTERRLAHYDRSAELLRKVITIDPQNAEAHALLGQDLARLEKSPDAVAQWKNVLEMDPENTQALYGLIRALSGSNSEELKTYQQRYATIQEKNRVLDRVQTLSNFAIAASDSKDYPRAIGQLTEALQLCGECRVLPVLHKNLGLIYLRSGNLVDGEREIRTSLSLDSKDAEARSALDRLESLRNQQQQEKR